MKKSILTLLLMLIIGMAASARTYVLVTGVSHYENEAHNLQQTTKDAKEFCKVMKTQTNDVTLLTSANADRQNIIDKLTLICRRATAGDRVIFYFSGHGTTGAIITYDELLYYKDIIDIFKQSKAEDKIMMVDVCRAGSAATGSGDYTLTGSDGIICFMSCRASETSAESSILGAGYFTQGLIKGIRGKGDSDRDKQITVHELFKYIHADVVKRSNGEQHPQLIAPKSALDKVIARW